MVGLRDNSADVGTDADEVDDMDLATVGDDFGMCHEAFESASSASDADELGGQGKSTGIASDDN
eukprot:3745460-Amphidinium_carterae.1